ncbi:hypothetical protein [Pseudomonas sp. zfem002]|uniref:hypothetical protein n=1 Tax=Pseudomonas sp. zfem002 TaxID=3078197 RepID=UPI0029281075|nr:hypothetical protein [Pseudomonas sp. zfem002]MDU9392082.1 hypothetical protein [Pseudomonas sp. zfem002]
MIINKNTSGIDKQWTDWRWQQRNACWDELSLSHALSGITLNLLIDDRQCCPQASAVRQKALGTQAWRDMLIVSCRKSAWKAPL